MNLSTPSAEKRVLFITYQFPPVGGAGVQRVTKFVKYLPDFGWQSSVLTVSKPSVPAYDDSLLAEAKRQLFGRVGIDMIDIGCGHGHAANLIADSFPASRTTGSVGFKKVTRDRQAALRNWRREGWEILARIRAQEPHGLEVCLPSTLAEDFRMPGRGMRSLKRPSATAGALSYQPPGN